MLSPLFNGRAAIAALVLTLFLPLSGAAQASEYLYIENSAGGDITVVSVPEHEIVGKIPASLIGRQPDDVVGSNSGDLLFVNRLEGRDVLVFSTATEELLYRIPVSGTPHHMTITRDDRFLYVPLFNDIVTEVIDLEQRRVVDRIPVSYGGHDTELSSDGKRVYVGNILAPRITVIEVATNRVVKVIPMPEGVRPFKVSPDEKKLWAQLSKLHGFVEVDVEQGRITKTVHLPTRGKVVPPEAFTTWPMTVGHGMEISPDGERLYVAATLYDFVAVYDLPSLDLVATVDTGKEPGWIAMSKDGRYIYTSNRGTGDHSLSIIDTASLREIKRIPNIGNFPQRMTTIRVPHRATRADVN